MSDGEPTLGEVLRRLDDVSRQMTLLATQMAQDRRDAADTYVRRDVYEARHSFLGRRVDELQADFDDRERAADQFRRQVLAGVLIAAVTAVLGLMVSILTFIATGGAP